MVGRCHENGWGTPKDVEEAARCYNLAAGLGYDWAQFNLGMLLVGGDAICRDLRTALTLFVRAARQGNAKAMNMLGRYREEGWHGRVKLGSAARWYARAAVRGCFRGQFHLARFYAAQGMVGEAVGWLRHSLNAAPADFCREASEILQRHDAPAIREMAAFARQRACVGPPT
jgi:TPR repeat protein